jgi:hypothetical protein
MPVEHVRECVAQNPSIEALESSCENAFALYQRTRPPASTESLKRSRLLPKPGPHPELVALAQERALADVSSDAGKVLITAALRRFRPAATVIEAQVGPLPPLSYLLACSQWQCCFSCHRGVSLLPLPSQTATSSRAACCHRDSSAWHVCHACC